MLKYQRYLVLSIHEDERRKALSQQGSEGDGDGSFQRLATLQPGDVLEEGHYRALSMLCAAAFHATSGAEAVRALLNALDLDALAVHLRAEIADGEDSQQKKAIRRLQIVEAFRSSGQQPAWMVLSVLPVLPPELRPLLLLDGGRIASSDVNDLYCRVLARNERVKHFLEQGAPEIMLNNECRQLQEACDALFDNAHTKKRATGSHNRPLKSLTENVQGKQGHFRRNLLGKRVDYSGRSVIVAGPQLLLPECGLPKEMACELFKPFLIRKLMIRHYARSPRGAKRMVERRDSLIWDPLDEVLFERLVLLNRAPTLHRLSIQAFYPRLIEGNAIQLHPLVCSAFNADFDGDQMAVHVPLSDRAQEEAQRVLLSTHNLRHPASGEPPVAPSQDMVLGCFYLTEEQPSQKKAGRLFTDSNEAQLAYANGFIDLHTRILVRIATSSVYASPPPAEPQSPPRGRVETTIGRVLFNEILPEPLGYRNYPQTLAEPAGALPAGTLLDAKLVDALHISGIVSLCVRSPFTCQAAYGICRHCYGSLSPTEILFYFYKTIIEGKSRKTSISVGAKKANNGRVGL